MKQLEKCSGREFDSPHLHQKDVMEDEDLRARVDVKTPWFSLIVEKIDWKEVMVVAMVLLTIIYLVKG